ncbi:MAG: hypothetical protein JNK27_01290 [Chitinophagaceae bacterium]|nr:hypothetical protein [Chitinophagaceae bacterium]
MKCIFCKHVSDDSKSVEHIIPESLGNTKNVLPRCVVCDKCNNYFSRKIEQPLLEQLFFKNLRGRNWIESKKGKIPPEEIMYIGAKEKAILHRNEKGTPKMILDIHDQNFFQKIFTGQKKELIFPFEIERPEANNRTIARFLGKIGVEALAQKWVGHVGWEEYHISHEGLDLLRNYVRYNTPNIEWPYSVRKIYGENEQFRISHNDNQENLDVLYEYDFLMEQVGIDLYETYICVAIKGYEFVLNVAGPEISGYIDWLKRNNNISPLYLKKNNKENPILPSDNFLPGQK